ncbi:phage Gp37/Gp68 family protein [Desulfitobacterium sp.]|uniref:phage Gp37/Gp68 family protein n=1 Tax=Desulfitobacterium sp. TaxID=49981 RepID=UPI002C3FF9C6|nr:phage Gp37/Gp68 family protein [Desulfitobacterium sp.]HVJ49393.1 phage Gp37/Gp68 family protein [Desulfitobacterium sp.]
MSITKIEWLNSPDGKKGMVWNPITGCKKISEGCRNCYAERMSKRLAGRCGYPKDDSFKVTLHPEKLDEPLKWKKPRRIFVNSMSDLFHDDVPDEFIDRVFAAMADASQHTFMILTKRPERMRKYLSPDNPRYTARKVFDLTQSEAGKFDCDLHWPLSNVWLGVSVENQAVADERIPLLLQTPAAVRFISMEPLLGPVNLTNLHYERVTSIDALNGFHGFPKPHAEGRKLDWVICGGETGPGARPCHTDWIRSLRDQCQSANIPFFFKSWGEYCAPSQMPENTYMAWECHHGTENCWSEDNPSPWKIGKKRSGCEIDGRTWGEFPKVRL